MGRIIVGLFLLLTLCACGGESAEQRAAREESERKVTALKLKQDEVKAKQAAYDKYIADCKAKNGNRHWGPFTLYDDYRNPHAIYKNGRYNTIKSRVPSVTGHAWDAAEKQHACVVASSDEYEVTIALDNGTSFVITKRVPERGVRKKDQKHEPKSVTSVSVSLR